MASVLPSFASDNLSLGVPGKVDQVIDREGYALGYDYNWKIPRWVTYRLTVDEIANPKAGRSEDVRPDPMLKAGAAQLEDYRGSGYDRGHMAPVANMKWSSKAMKVAKAESEDQQLCGHALVEQAEMDAWNRGERVEYRSGGAMPVSSRKAAPVNTGIEV